MASSVFLGTLQNVSVDQALGGDGSVLNPLNVLVDGDTVRVNGSNELEAVSPVDGLSVTAGGESPNRTVQLLYQDGEESVVLAETVY